MNGHIKRIVREKGFGFIRSLSGKDVFFHRTGMQSGPKMFDLLNEGDSVTFEVEQSDKGPRAVQVRESYEDEP